MKAMDHWVIINKLLSIVIVSINCLSLVILPFALNAMLVKIPSCLLTERTLVWVFTDD